MYPSDDKPRILIITDDVFKKKVQLKAMKEGRTLSAVIRELLNRWLKEK